MISAGDKEHPHVHVMPLKIYFGVFGALIALTVLTVSVSYMGLGVFAIYAAMLVALVKGGLVVGYFMHLKFDTKFHQLIFFGSLFFMTVFFVFVFIDLSSRARINPESGNYALARDRAAKALAAYQEKQDEARERSQKMLSDKVTVEDLNKAKAVYVSRCQSCHGPKGKGHGPAGAALKPPPRDYTDLGWQKRTSNMQIAKVILKGGIGTGLSPTMPPHPDLRPQVAAMVAYIRSFGGIDMIKKPDAKTPDAKTPNAKTPNAKTPAADAKTPAADAKTRAADAKTPAADAKTPAADAKTPAADAKTPTAADAQKPAPAPEK